MAKVATPEVIGTLTFKGHAWGVRAETAHQVDFQPGDKYDVLLIDVGRDGRPIYTLADPHQTYIPDPTTYNEDGKVMHPGADAAEACTIRIQIAEAAALYKPINEPGPPAKPARGAAK